MPRFKPYDTSQNLLLPINLAEQLVPGTFEHTLNYLVNHEIDTSIFHEHYHNEQTDRLGSSHAVEGGSIRIPPRYHIEPQD